MECFFRINDAASLSDACERVKDCSCAVFFVSPPFAGGGLLWFEALLTHGGCAKTSAIIDCGDDRGLVLAALARGFKRVVFAGASASLAGMAQRWDAHLRGKAPECCGCPKDG